MSSHRRDKITPVVNSWLHTEVLSMMGFYNGSLVLWSCLQPTSIVSYNHLGNNDGMNLSAPQTFRSKEISKSNVVDDMVASNSILYSPGEHPDHVVVIKVQIGLLSSTACSLLGLAAHFTAWPVLDLLCMFSIVGICRGSTLVSVHSRVNCAV